MSVASSKAAALEALPTQILALHQAQTKPLLVPQGSAIASCLPPELHLGRMFGNFLAIRKIGEGGMGIVYEARHCQIGRRAAIKIMHKGLAQNAEYAARFLNEARAVNIIQHRGLVEISEYGKLEDGTLFIVMEYLSGQSLRERIIKNNKKTFADKEVTHLAVQLARALAAAHEKGIIHRDLKPDKVTIERQTKKTVPRRSEVLANHGLRCGTTRRFYQLGQPHPSQRALPPLLLRPGLQQRLGHGVATM